MLDQIFADVSGAGYDGIELMHTALLPEDAELRLASLSKRYRLRVIGSSFDGPMWNRDTHAGVFTDAGRIVSRLARLGGFTLGVSVGNARAPKTPEQLDAQADLLTRLIALCEAHGVVLNLHNHIYEVQDDEYDLRGTLARVPQVKLGPDLNWLLRAGVDPVAFLRRYGDRVVFVHLRDQHVDGRWSEALGEGDMDYDAIGRALRNVGFSGPAVVELAHERDFVPTRPIRESLRLSLDFARRVLS
jgi:sugar phosphate isomerase/epimerase